MGWDRNEAIVEKSQKIEKTPISVVWIAMRATWGKEQGGARATA